MVSFATFLRRDPKHRPFMFATGIECSYPTIKNKAGKIIRVDEFEKTGHYRHWKTDLKLVKELGINFLRYGPPYYKTHSGPGRYDWAFADETFNRLKDLDIIPIADLCHFGLPDWLESFQNPDFPHFFAEYAADFARRFPWVELFTPVNEIRIACEFSALNGCGMNARSPTAPTSRPSRTAAGPPSSPRKPSSKSSPKPSSSRAKPPATSTPKPPSPHRAPTSSTSAASSASTSATATMSPAPSTNTSSPTP